MWAFQLKCTTREPHFTALLPPQWLPASLLWGNRQHILVEELLVEMHRLALLAQPQVEDLDKNREGHREVDVPLRNVLSQPLGHERHADQEQEAQRQDLHGRMA